jgi:hypothetical protein
VASSAIPTNVRLRAKYGAKSGTIKLCTNICTRSGAQMRCPRLEPSVEQITAQSTLCVRVTKKNDSANDLKLMIKTSGKVSYFAEALNLTEESPDILSDTMEGHS